MRSLDLGAGGKSAGKEEEEAAVELLGNEAAVADPDVAVPAVAVDAIFPESRATCNVATLALGMLTVRSPNFPVLKLAIPATVGITTVLGPSIGPEVVVGLDKPRSFKIP